MFVVCELFSTSQKQSMSLAEAVLCFCAFTLQFYLFVPLPPDVLKCMSFDPEVVETRPSLLTLFCGPEWLGLCIVLLKYLSMRKGYSNKMHVTCLFRVVEQGNSRQYLPYCSKQNLCQQQ